MLSLFITMGFISAGINFANYRTSISLIYQMLDNIVENDGEVLLEQDHFGWESNFSNAFRPHYWQYQYYTCIFDSNGRLLGTIDRQEGDNDNTELMQYAAEILNNGQRVGRYGRYFYKSGITSGDNPIVVFIDGAIEISSSVRLLYWTIMICNVGLVVTFVLVWFFSKQMIQPEIENSKRQRQFITNASHELKTPLAVIRANVELEAMMNGETELSRSTLKQVDHMNGLIQNLVMIARSEEKEDKEGMIEENVTGLVQESVESFRSAATQENLNLVCQIEDNVHRTINGSKLRQLTTILVDNAIKYCDEGGTITVSLATIRRGRGLQLEVSNTYAAGATVDYSRFFDRFYREDQSHNIDKGGYGIGLSIAESICKQSGGTIKVEWKDGVITFLCRLM